MSPIKSLFLILIFIFISCEKNEDLSPSEQILGKWEIIQMGNWPQMFSVTDNGYTEFLSDSTMIQNYYDTTAFDTYAKYWVDTVLHISQKYENGFVLTTKFKYDFHNNKLRLDILGVRANINTIIYQRLE